MWLARELLAEVYAAPDLAVAKRRLIVFFQFGLLSPAE